MLNRAGCKLIASAYITAPDPCQQHGQVAASYAGASMRIGKENAHEYYVKRLRQSPKACVSWGCRCPLIMLWYVGSGQAAAHAASDKQLTCSSPETCEEKDFSPESGEWYGEFFPDIPKIK